MLSAYGEHGEGARARDLFKWMLQKGIKPNDITFVNLLNAYAHSGLVDEALNIFESMTLEFNIQKKISHCALSSTLHIHTLSHLQLALKLSLIILNTSPLVNCILPVC